MSGLHPDPGIDLERLLDQAPEALAEALRSDREAAEQRECHLLLRAAFRGRARPTLPARFDARLERRLADRRTAAAHRAPTPIARILLGLYWLAATAASFVLVAARIDLPAAGALLAEGAGHLALRWVPGSLPGLAVAQVAVLASLLLVVAPSAIGTAIRRLLRPILA